MNYSKCLFSVVFLLFCIGLFAGPFGLEMGMSLEDIGGESKKISAESYVFKTVPKPHSAFAFYFLKIAPKEGLYRVTALGKSIKCGPDGYQIKIEFNDLKKILENNYGKCRVSDRLSRGSAWDESGDWMMSMVMEHRTYAAGWDKEYKESSLPPDLESIILGVRATSRNEASIVLCYDFMNSDSCETEISAEENSAL